jgi:hypothetical protein
MGDVVFEDLEGHRVQGRGDGSDLVRMSTQ